jgi:hypothetical protein
LATANPSTRREGTQANTRFANAIFTRTVPEAGHTRDPSSRRGAPPSAPGPRRGANKIEGHDVPPWRARLRGEGCQPYPWNIGRKAVFPTIPGIANNRPANL